MNEHKCEWIETGKVAGGTTYKCEGCGGIMARGPGLIHRENSFQEQVVDAVVADLKANGRIRMAILGTDEHGR